MEYIYPEAYTTLDAEEKVLLNDVLTFLVQHELFVCIYGPPGTGKSTVIARANALIGRFAAGVDLEVYAQDVRPVVLEVLGGRAVAHVPMPIPGLPPVVDSLRNTVIIGMADQRVENARRYTRAFHVLLLPRYDAYTARRLQRDAQHPNKAGQMDVYPGFARAADRFDVTLDTADMDADHALLAILSLAVALAKNGVPLQ